MSSNKTGCVLGTPVAISNRSEATEEILRLARSGQSSYICFSTAHMLVECMQDDQLRAAYRNAGRIHADGRPVAWALQLTGHPEAQCVSGPQLTPELLTAAEAAGISVGFYGGRQETIDRMLRALRRDYPQLKVAYSFSPPFRALSTDERKEVLRDMRRSGAKILFIGLGSPKQELWMGENTKNLPCVLLGVGAVFEFLSGEKFMPPVWIQNLGLTWLVRLCQEPRRLVRRNLVYSPLFVARFLQQQILSSSRAEGRI